MCPPARDIPPILRTILRLQVCFLRCYPPPARPTLGISTKRRRHDARSPMAGTIGPSLSRPPALVPGSLPGSFTAFTLSEYFRTRLDFVRRSTVFISSGLSVGEVDALIVSG